MPLALVSAQTVSSCTGAPSHSNLRAVELDAFIAHDLLQDERADKVADDQTVRRRLEKRIGRHPAAGAGHVVDDDRRVARYVAAHVTGDDARVGIEAAAGGKANDDADGFAAIEILIRCGGVRRARCDKLPLKRIGRLRV